MWYKIHNNQVELFVLVKPNAKQSCIVSHSEGELHIHLKAQAQEGEANKALITFLSKSLKTPQKDIVLKRGEISRHKVLQLPMSEKLREFIDSEGKLL